MKKKEQIAFQKSVIYCSNFVFCTPPLKIFINIVPSLIIFCQYMYVCLFVYILVCNFAPICLDLWLGHYANRLNSIVEDVRSFNTCTLFLFPKRSSASYFFVFKIQNPGEEIPVLIQGKGLYTSTDIKTRITMIYIRRRALLSPLVSPSIPCLFKLK